MIKLWRFLSVPIVLAVCLGLLLVPALPPVALAQGTAGLEVVPNMTTVGFNEDFDLQIWTNAASNQSIDGVGAFLNFSPTYMQVNSITPGTALSLVLANSFSNTSGTINYSAGELGTPPTGDFLVCTINCTSKGVAGVSAIDFVIDGPLRATDITLIGASIINWGMVVNGTLTVTGIPILWVNVTPNGSGDVDISGASIPPSYPNTTNWTWGANVTLTAIAAGGWEFDQWMGDLTGSTNPDNITMDGDKNVTANFTPLAPQISPVPTNRTFNATEGGANPANKTLNICNSGGGILNWTLADDAGWLSVSPTSGGGLANGTCNSTQVAVNITNMTAGTYLANITITAPGAINSPRTVPVILNISPPGVPAIQASPIPLTFTAVEGEDPPDQTLTICNSGTGTLNWSLTDNAGWLSESPTSGSLGAGECENVVVSVDVSGMELGDYSATITITGSLEKKVPVSLHIVSALPAILVGPAQLSASALDITPQQVQSGRDVTISINVANTGGETGSYNAVLYINGVVEDSQSVSVAAGISKNVIFTVTKTKAGVYDVSLAGQSGQFEVVGGGGWFGGGGLGTGGIIAIVVVVIILIGAVVFILRGTTKPE